MATEICTVPMPNFSFCQEAQTGSRPPYILLTADVDKITNSRQMLELLRNKICSRELAAQEIWQSYQIVYPGTEPAVRYKMSTSASIECRLGHIPMTVIAWRGTGTGVCDIEVVGCVDTSRMPPHHPNVFNVASSSQSPSSSLFSSIISRLVKFRRASTETTNYLCQISPSTPSSLLCKVWRSCRQIRTCIIILALLFAFPALSLFLGIFFTVKKSYGLSPGDAFTVAGYVIAVGGFFTAVIGAFHFPYCNCWQRGRGRVKMCTE